MNRRLSTKKKKQTKALEEKIGENKHSEEKPMSPISRWMAKNEAIPDRIFTQNTMMPTTVRKQIKAFSLIEPRAYNGKGIERVNKSDGKQNGRLTICLGFFHFPFDSNRLKDAMAKMILVDDYLMNTAIP